jgi:hypothetical protein
MILRSSFLLCFRWGLRLIHGHWPQRERGVLITLAAGLRTLHTYRLSILDSVIDRNTAFVVSDSLISGLAGSENIIQNY